MFTIKDSSGDNSGKITGGKNGVIFAGKASIFNFEGDTITGTSFTYTFTIRGVSADGTTYTTGYNSTGWTIVHK